MATTAKGVPYPVATDSNDVPVDIRRLADWLDARPGVSALTTAQRDALTGVDLWNGRVIYNLTTTQLERYDAAALAWRATVVDHGQLTGLADDDHPQYLLKTDNLAALTDKALARTNLGANTAYPLRTEMAVRTAFVTNREQTPSTTFTDLATIGPVVTFIAPPSGVVLVSLNALVQGDAFTHMSFEVRRTSDGVVTHSPGLDRTLGSISPIRAGVSVDIRGLVAGVEYRVTAKYRVDSGTGLFDDRTVHVIPST